MMMPPDLSAQEASLRWDGARKTCQSSAEQVESEAGKGSEKCYGNVKEMQPGVSESVSTS